MIVLPDVTGRYSKQKVYDWLLNSRPSGKRTYSYILRTSGADLHARLTEILGDDFSTFDLFKFLQPSRTRCLSCRTPLTYRKGDMERFSFKKGFGVTFCSRECAQSSKDVRRKIEETHLRIRGVSHSSSDPSVVAKRKATYLERYGAPGTFGSRLEDAAKATMKKRYGAACFSQTPEWVEKVERTNLQVRGVRWVTQDPDVFDRAKRSFRRKQVAINGKTYRVQGYEHWVLKHLEKKIAEVITKTDQLPRLEYSLAGKTRRYFPDALLHFRDGRAYLLEVKSTYTVVSNLKQDTRKFLAALEWCEKNDTTFLLAVAKSVTDIQLFEPKNKTDIQHIFKKFSREQK